MQATSNRTAGIRCGIYARVSTDMQDCSLQLNELREYAARNAWTIIDEYVDEGVSGTKSSRPELNRLLADVRTGRITLICCWKLDRLCRSLSHLVSVVQELDSLGCRLISTTQGIDTDRNNPMSKLLTHLPGAFSEFERSLLVERTVAGVRAARARGRVAGRPKRIFNRAEVARLREDGISWRRIARELNIPVSTAVDAFHAYRTENVPTSGPAGDGNRETSDAAECPKQDIEHGVRYRTDIVQRSPGIRGARMTRRTELAICAYTFTPA